MSYELDLQERIQEARENRGDDPTALALLSLLEGAMNEILNDEVGYDEKLKVILATGDAIQNLSADDHDDWSDLIEIIELLRQLAHARI